MKRLMLLYIIISMCLSVNALEIKDFLSSDLMACMFIDYSKLSEKGIVKKLQKDSNTDKKHIFLDYQKKTGFKPENDLHNIYILIPEDLKMNKQSVGMIFKGKFNKNKSIDFFKDLDKKSEITSTKIKGKEIYIAKDNYSFCFVDNNTLLMGGKDFLIDLLNTKKPKAIKKDKKNDFDLFFNKSKNNSFSGFFKLSQANKNKASKLYPNSALIKDIDSFDFISDIDKDVTIVLNISSRSMESASQLKDVLNKLKFAGIMYGAKAGLSQMISGIEINSDQKNTTIKIVLTAQDIVKLAELSKKLNKKDKS